MVGLPTLAFLAGNFNGASLRFRAVLGVSSPPADSSLLLLVDGSAVDVEPESLADVFPGNGADTD